MGNRCYIEIWVRASDAAVIAAAGFSENDPEAIPGTGCVMLTDAEGYADSDRVPAGVPFLMSYGGCTGAYGPGVIAGNGKGGICEYDTAYNSRRPFVELRADGTPELGQMKGWPILREAAAELGVD